MQRRFISNGDPTDMIEKTISEARAARREYLRILRRMTPEQRLHKAFELSEFGKKLFLAGLRRRYPDASEEEIWAIYLRRIEKCHNRNY